MTVQAYFRNFGIALSWIERLVIIAFSLWGINKVLTIYSQVGLQKSLILFVLVGFVIAKMIYQYWIKPLIWKKKNQKTNLQTFFWEFDRLENKAGRLSIKKRLILFAVLGFLAMVSGTFFSMFLYTGQYDIKFFFLSAIVFVITFRNFSQIVKSLG